MKTKFNVPQPPISEKYNFLVDDISKNGSWGTVTGMEMINYNLDLLGVNFQMQAQIQLPLSDRGVSGVVPIGKFITVIQIKKDETSGSMTFFDFQVDPFENGVIDQVKDAYSDNIFNRWLEIYYVMVDEFLESDDTVVLYKP